MLLLSNGSCDFWYDCNVWGVGHSTCLSPLGSKIDISFHFVIVMAKRTSVKRQID
jgi:hypothetical protein